MNLQGQFDLPVTPTQLEGRRYLKKDKTLRLRVTRVSVNLYLLTSCLLRRLNRIALLLFETPIPSDGMTGEFLVAVDVKSGGKINLSYPN